MARRIAAATIGAWLAVSLLNAGCPERGAAADDEDGSEGGSPAGEIDCGEHGSAHGDHCHCYQGYLFDGQTCVAPEDITEICEDHSPTELVHFACVCPAEGPCFCDGTIVDLAGESYCEPELH